MHSDGPTPSDTGDTTALPAELQELATDRLFAVARLEREAVCAALVAAHPAHRLGLQRLLREVNGAERLLDRSFAAAAEEHPGAIGGHRVVRQLGEGAFGSVYLCAQERPVVRQVAVKLLRPGAGDRSTLRRFEAERQLLASLNHPAITQIYDAGHMPNGQPFFVMEYVDGVPITEYCSAHDLAWDARLRLFVALCRGVEYAHRRGVVHRDLKPANVLVLDVAGEPQPKIIDFGIAKVVAGGDGEPPAPPATDAGRVLGTPGYMSPEQAGGRTGEVDERSDAFALGVMLYELLTGELPWPRGVAADSGTPVLPSARLATKAHRIAGRASTAHRRLAALVRGDLDWIVRKATELEPAARYANVRELAEDLERHLAGRPVLAGPPTLGYRLRKFVRRNRAASWSFGAGLLLAVGGLSWAVRHASSAEAGAARAGRDAKASFAEASAAVATLLQRANDDTVRGTPQSEGVRRALAADALAFYDRWLRERPEDPALREGRGRALLTLSQVHFMLAQYEEALRTAGEAAQEAQILVAAETDKASYRGLLAEAIRKQARTFGMMGRWKEMRPLIDRAVAELDACAQQAPADYGRSLSSALREKGSMHGMLGEDEASLEALRRSVTVLEGLVARGENVESLRNDLLLARIAWAGQLIRLDKLEEGEVACSAAEAMLGELGHGRLRATTMVYTMLARLSLERGEPEVAVQRLTRAAQAAEEWCAQEPEQRLAYRTLRLCLRDLSRDRASLDLAGSLAAMHRDIEVAELVVERFPGDPTRVFDLRVALYDHANTLFGTHRRSVLPEAEAWLRRAITLQQQLPAGADQRPWLWQCRCLLARIGDANAAATATQWEELAASLPDQVHAIDRGLAEDVFDAWLGVTGSRLRRAQPGSAGTSLEHAAALLEVDGLGLDESCRSDVAWWRARLALANGDVEAAAAHVAELLELRGTWLGRLRAADCEREAWRRLEQAGTAAEQVAVHRDRAASLYRSVVDELAERAAGQPEDPAAVLPWGLAGLGLAECEAGSARRDDAMRRLDEVLPALARIEPEAHRDRWDDARVAAARELRARLAAERR